VVSAVSSSKENRGPMTAIIIWEEEGPVGDSREVV
jgi:hypothetical protein